MLNRLQVTVSNILDKITQYISKYPIICAISLMIMYFILDSQFMIGTGTKLVGDEIILASLFMSYFAYYITYLRKRSTSNLDNKENKRDNIFFYALIIVTLSLFLGYDSIVVKYLPSISNKYYKSEIIVFLVLAPIFEELSFRYLLYDNWAKEKYGKIIGGIIIGIIFIIFHPITNFTGFAMYWLPTLFLFMTYDSGGIKASITAHMLYNIVALL